MLIIIFCTSGYLVRHCSFFISSYRLLATGMVVARSVPLGVMVWLGEVEGEFLLTFLVDMMTPRFLFMVTFSKFTLILIFWLDLFLVLTVITFGRTAGREIKDAYNSLPSVSLFGYQSCYFTFGCMLLLLSKPIWDPLWIDLYFSFSLVFLWFRFNSSTFAGDLHAICCLYHDNKINFCYL